MNTSAQRFYFSEIPCKFSNRQSALSALSAFRAKKTWYLRCDDYHATLHFLDAHIVSSQLSPGGGGVACSQICIINRPIPGEHLENDQDI